MKIVGGRDYYDGAGLGVDPSIVFVRTGPLSINEDHPVKLPGIMNTAGSKYGLWQYQDKRETDPRLDFFLALVAGEVYPGAVLKEGAHGFLKREKFIYDWSEVDELLPKRKRGSKGYYWREEYPRAQAHFERPKDQLLEWALEKRVVTAIFYPLYVDEFSHYPRRVGIECRANTDDLKLWEVFRALDALTAHMRIADWIGGVLPYSSEVIEVSDRSKLLKAGFDAKISFRKAPTKRLTSV